MRCSVPNCVNDTKQATKSHGLAFLRFPKEASLRVAWAEALGLPAEPQERSTVCSEHFYPDDLYLTKNGLWKVKNGALPVIQEPLEDLDMTAVLRVCRICLATDTKMFDMVEYKLDTMYEEVTGLPLLPCPRLPAAACWQCAGRLRRGAALRRAAAAAHRALADLLAAKHNTPLRPALCCARRSLPAGPRLCLQRYEPNDCDLHIKDNQIFVKTETETEDDVTKLEEEDEDNNADVIPPIMEVEIKDEQSNSDMFFEEFLDFDESDDDKKLSEVVTEKKEKVKEKKRKKKLKADKAEKKVKKKEKEKKEKVEEEKTEDDDPNSTMDKYKTSDVKRRRTQDCLDESLFTVTALSYDEQIQDILKRQDSTNYRTAPYKCETCYRGFLNKDRYNAHVIRHSEASGAYECFICKTRLRSGRALRKHLTAQHTEKFSCKGCPFVTRNRGVAREHEKWHAGTKYQCPHCPSEFDKVTTYMGHIRIKHVSDFVCELCGYTFVSRKGVDVHKKKKHRLDDKTVPATGPYCAACDVRFTSAEAHERHLKLSSRHSSDNDPNRIRNDSQSMNAEKHGRVMRKIERRPVVHPREPGGAAVGGSVTCEQCGIQLRDLRLYAQHFRRAHPDKNRTKYPAMKTPCMCEQCGRIFQSMALLKDHMWVHTGEKRFKCDRCDKAFTQKTNLVFHMRVHSNARPSYECPLCGKHFAFFNNRRRHMFIHTGLKPFKCDTCGKCFTTAGEQRAHVDHVHMKKPWPKRVRARQQDWGKQVED